MSNNKEIIKTGTRSFLIIQLLAWIFVAIVNALIQELLGVSMQVIVINAFSLCGFGILFTSFLRRIIKRQQWLQLSLIQLLLRILIWVNLIAVLFTGFVYLIFVKVFFVSGFQMRIDEIISTFFVFAVILVAWNFAYFGIHYLNRSHSSEVEKWQLSSELKEAQLNALKSQINPHFVFNTINNIRSLILDDKEKAREMLLNFSDLFRYALSYSGSSLVAIEQELEILNMYFELLEIQYGENLTITTEIDDEISNFQLPPMIIQLFIENAVKHGMSQFEKGAEISLKIRNREEVVHICVINNGIMKANKGGKSGFGLGTRNIKKRLDLIYGDRASMSLSQVGSKVHAELIIPKQ